MRALPLVFAATAVIAAAAVATPASADTSGPTNATFAVTGGTLDITAPSTAELGTTIAGGEALASLGPVEVQDKRSALAAVWTANVVSSNFVTGSGTHEETIPARFVRYEIVAPPSTSGTGTTTRLHGLVKLSVPTVVMPRPPAQGTAKRGGPRRCSSPCPPPRWSASTTARSRTRWHRGTARRAAAHRPEAAPARTQSPGPAPSVSEPCGRDAAAEPRTLP